MKLDDRARFSPKLSIGLKRLLLELNRDLDRIKDRIRSNADYGIVVFDHSIDPRHEELALIERMILFLEDRRFFVHNGLELKAIARLVRRLLRGRGLGGISTIEQQVVRIVTRRRDRTVGRKFREIVLAFAVNFHCSKREILDFYIHYSYFGYRLEGCENASKHIFGLPASALNASQAAFLASLLPLPLPRIVYDALAMGDIRQGTTPEDIIERSAVLAPRWAERVKFRYRIALENHDFTPKSL